MVQIALGVRRFTLAALASGAILAAPVTYAGALTTDVTVPNFTFDGAMVDYDPDPEQFSLNAVTRVGSDSWLSDYKPRHGFRDWTLHLNAAMGESGGDFELSYFGSIPNASSVSEIELLKGSLSALDWDTKGSGQISFLIDESSVTGKLAVLARSYGIHVEVDGLDPVAWVNGFQDAAATVQLLQLEDQQLAALNDPQPVPLPGTLLLVLAGLLLPATLRARARA